MQKFNPVKKEDNYELEPETEGPILLGDVEKMTLSTELTRESIIEFHEFLLDAARSGHSFVTEKESGSPVWNYGTNGRHFCGGLALQPWSVIFDCPSLRFEKIVS